MVSTAQSTRGRRLASIPAAAEYVGVSAKTVRRWIANGHISGYRAGPRLIRVDLNELDVMLSPVGRTDS